MRDIMTLKCIRHLNGRYSKT